MINEQSFNKMLAQIKDPVLKQRLVDMAAGNITNLISCLSKTCKGRVIGYLYDTGMLEADELRDKNGGLVSGALAIRQRFDGYYGVECACGNDSRIAEAEKGIMQKNGQAPTKEDMDSIYYNLGKKPAHYIEKSGSIEIDGFIIGKVKI